MAARYQVKKLIDLYSNICHYCKKPCDSGSQRRYPTREHVVPRCFGGENSMSNYVLACAACNNKRGTSLFFCECRDCRELILDALYNEEVIDTIIEGIEDHNRPIIKKTHINSDYDMQWVVRIGHNKKHFKTFEKAIEFATTNAIAKDRDYGLRNTER